MTIQFDEEKQKLKLEEINKKEEEDFAKVIAKNNKIDYINLILVPINTDALRLIEEETARGAKMAAFNLIGKTVQVAVISPIDDDTKKVIQTLTESGLSVIVFTTTTESLEKAWRYYKDLSYST